MLVRTVTAKHRGESGEYFCALPAVLPSRPQACRPPHYCGAPTGPERRTRKHILQLHSSLHSASDWVCYLLQEVLGPRVGRQLQCCIPVPKKSAMDQQAYGQLAEHKTPASPSRYAHFRVVTHRHHAHLMYTHTATPPLPDAPVFSPDVCLFRQQHFQHLHKLVFVAHVLRHARRSQMKCVVAALASGVNFYGY